MLFFCSSDLQKIVLLVRQLLFQLPAALLQNVPAGTDAETTASKVLHVF